MSDRKTISWIIKHTSEVKIQIVFSSLCGVFSALSAVSFILCSKKLIDMAVKGETDQLPMYALLMILLILLQKALDFVYRYINESAGTKLGNQLRQWLLEQMTVRQYEDIMSRHSGDWLNRMFSDVDITAQSAASILPATARLLAQLIFSFGLLFYLAPILGLGLTTLGTAMIIMVQLLRKRVKMLHKDAQQKSDKVRSVFQETVENLLIVKVFGREDARMSKASAAQAEYYTSHMKRRLLSLEANTVFLLVFRLAYGIALIIGAVRIAKGELFYGTLSALLQVISQIQSPIAGVSGIIPKIHTMIASAERIMEAEEYPEEVLSDTIDGEIDNICFRDVSFSYGVGKVFEHVNFIIHRNETIALTGISGAGKSTIFLLLLGVYHSVSGKIEICTNARSYTPGRNTRKQFAYVPQGNALFSGTIRENICFDRDEDIEKLIQALKTAEAYEFVMSQPEKLDHEIRERGDSLSEGQKQRLAIARAVYSDAPVLLLDEATSALDAETEKRVLHNISKLEGRTCIFVTHRDAPLSICDRKIILENGRTTSVCVK